MAKFFKREKNKLLAITPGADPKAEPKAESAAAPAAGGKAGGKAGGNAASQAAGTVASKAASQAAPVAESAPRSAPRLAAAGPAPLVIEAVAAAGAEAQAEAKPEAHLGAKPAAPHAATPAAMARDAAAEAAAVVPAPDRALAKRGAGPVVQGLGIAHETEMMVALRSLPGTPLPNLLGWERCRVLRTHVAQLSRDRGLRSLLVTSAVAGEGKTLMSANLALSFSQLDGKRVLLIDADLRRPSLSEFFSIQPKAGLSDCLQNGKGLKDVCHRLHANLDFVPTLPAQDDSVELLNRQRMRELMEEAAAYDMVIVDSPPMSPIADTQVLNRLVDGSLLVVRTGVAHFELVRQAAELLQPKLLGAILNGVTQMGHSRYFYRYYNRYARERG